MKKGKEYLKKIDRRIGANIKAIRRSLGLRQIDLGAVAGVSKQQICRYEGAYNSIPVCKLYYLAKFFGVPMEYFFKNLTKKVIPKFSK